MRKKALHFIRDFKRSLQILYLRFAYIIARVFRKKLKINYTAVVDTVVISNLSTLVWSGRRCYKIELADGSVFSGFTKVIPITIDEDTTEVSVKFYGVGRIVKKTIPINRKRVSINLNDIVANALPQSLSISKKIKSIALSEQRTTVVQIPAPKISFPQFVNE
jgi:hypothetical protein